MALTPVPNDPHSKMPVTTLKRCQYNPEWWYTVEDCFTEVLEEPRTGLHIMYYDSHRKEGKTQLSVCIEDALLIRDAINQLYPPEVYPAKWLLTGLLSMADFSHAVQAVLNEMSIIDPDYFKRGHQSEDEIDPE